ncbi:MAG: hypothetical protein Q9215_003491 [Flavoplaca cf. flavocitrina]
MRKARSEFDPGSQSSLSLKVGDTSESSLEEPRGPQEVRRDSLEQRGQASGGRSEGPFVQQAEAEAHQNKPNAHHVAGDNSVTSQQVSATNDPVVMPVAVGVHTLGAPEQGTTGQPSSSSDPSPQGWFKRTFSMIIHGKEQNAQRVACLDTCADLDVISHRVVEDLGLQTEKYEGAAVKPLGGSYQPERQITLSWHVLNFPKTYTTTFAVFDEKYSKDFDVLLGRLTINKIRLYRKARNVWFSATEGDDLTVPPGSQNIIGSGPWELGSEDNNRGFLAIDDSYSGVVRNEKGLKGQLPDHNIAGLIDSSTESLPKASIDLGQVSQPTSARQSDQWQHSYDAVADKAIMNTGPSFGVLPQRFRNTCEINVSHLGRLINTPLTAVLDTTFDINLIDSTIVEEFGLTKTKRQRNTKNFNSASFTATGWEVLIDWHITGFGKQHNDTFLLVNLKASGYENDVILGQDTIRSVGFFPEAAEDAPSEAPSLTTGSTLSTASVEGFLEAAEDVAELLFQDPVLNPLYHKSLGVFKINEFERKFAKLLRGFASQLRTESVNDIHQKAVRFLKTRTNLIVSHMGHRLDPEKTELAQRFRQLASQKPKKIMQSNAIERNGIVELELPSSSGSSEPEEPENAYLYHREQVRSFILQSNALSNLRENFGRLVLQSHFEVKNSADATPNTTATVEERITPTLDPQSNDDENKSSELIYAPSKWLIGNNLRNPFSANTGRCIQLMFRIAEFLELREMPLRPGCNRIRWTCVCGASLYDDFRDMSNGSLRALQQMLDTYKQIPWSAASGSSVQEHPESVGSSITGNPSSGSQDSTTTVATGFDEGQEYGTTGDQRSTGLRRREYGNNNTENPIESRTWVLPIYHSERYRMKVEHVDVHKTRSDFEMFQSIKKKYYESKSITKRLLAMRGVKEIKFVKSGTQADGDAIPDEEAAPAVDHGSSGLQNPDLSCYIFLRTPKKIGEPLIADDRATPEAWVCQDPGGHAGFFDAGEIIRHPVPHLQK